MKSAGEQKLIINANFHILIADGRLNEFG